MKLEQCHRYSITHRGFITVCIVCGVAADTRTWDQQAFLVWMQCYRNPAILPVEVVKGNKQFHCSPVAQNLFVSLVDARQLCAEPAFS